MGISVRVFCYSATAELKAVPLALASQMYSILSPPRVPELAGTSARFMEIAVELQDRKPVRIIRTNYYLLRFDAAGVPDSGRLAREMIAAVDWAWMRRNQENRARQTVIDAEGRFKHRGARWVPTSSEKRQIEEAALGRLKVKRVAVFS